jgi:hypothetical protein
MTRVMAWVAAAAVVAAYPVATLATGAPRFPTRGECVRPATVDGPIDAVFGYFDDVRRAQMLRDRAQAVGFVGAEAAWDACGRLRVSVHGIPTLAVGRQLAAEAQRVGLRVTLEQAG